MGHVWNLPPLRLVKQFLEFFRDIIRNRALILTLTKRDIKASYLGSFLGLLWAFLQPLVTIFVMWFVFQFGLRVPPVIDFPFSLWLVAGLIPWFFFSGALITATYAVLEYSYLVKNITVRLSILPIVKIISALVVHVAMVLVVVVMFTCYRRPPDIYWLQLPYFVFCTVVLLLGLTWITSSLVLFVRDVGQAVQVIVQLGFWCTPVVWNVKLVPPQYQWLIKLNPALYIVEGFRDALIYKIWFWDRFEQTPYFWSFTIVVFCFGAILFKRLRPHFADVI